MKRWRIKGMEGESLVKRELLLLLTVLSFSEQLLAGCRLVSHGQTPFHTNV